MRSSPGCLPCRQRRKRCDLKKPLCNGCQRNFLICAWKPTPDSEIDCVQAKPLILTSVPGPSMPSILSRPDSQFLYSHFIHCTAPAISTQSQASNPFLHVLLPTALQHDVVLQALLSLSGIHCLEKDCKMYSQITWEHNALALRGLKYGLTRFTAAEPELALPLVLSTLLFCFIEVIRGDTDGNVFHHLKATQHIILALTRDEISSIDTATYRFVLEWYYYLFSLSIICDARVDDSHVLTHSTALFQELLGDKIVQPTGVLFGCAQDLFRLIPQTTAIAKRIHVDRQILGEVSSEVACARNSLLFLVQNWQAPSMSVDYATAGQIYQLALLLLLQADSNNAAALHSNAECLPDLLHRLPVDSCVTTTLCWPLSVIGSLAISSTCRGTIRSYLLSMEARYRFKNISQTLALLERLWGERGSPTGVFTLQYMMETQGYYFLLA